MSSQVTGLTGLWDVVAALDETGDGVYDLYPEECDRAGGPAFTADAYGNVLDDDGAIVGELSEAQMNSAEGL